MEAKLFASLYELIVSLHHPRRKGVQFSDRWIALVYLWSVLHDRPASWACDQSNWPKTLDRPLPSQSCLSRRLRTVGVLQLLERARLAVSDLSPTPLVKEVDSKPMIVGAYSKDRDAKRGRVSKEQMARGYRLHAVSHGRNVQQWTLASMNEHDASVAPRLLSQLQGGGYLVADNAYDSNDCHALAMAANHQLVAPPRGVNKGVRDLKYNLPVRIRALDMLDSPLKVCGLSGAFGKDLYNMRQRIESCFGGLTITGLGPLPAWARGPRRVALWTAGKILLQLCRTAVKEGLMK